MTEPYCQGVSLFFGAGNSECRLQPPSDGKSEQSGSLQSDPRHYGWLLLSSNDNIQLSYPDTVG